MFRRRTVGLLAVGLTVLPAHTLSAHTLSASALPAPSVSVAPAQATASRAFAAAPTGAVAAPAARPVLRPGSRGAAVVTLQKRLANLGYWVGTTNGRYDHETGQAVMALQKVAGLTRDGVMGPKTWAALDKGVVPTPRSTTGRVLEVDLTRQVLLFVVDGSLRYVVNTSTGTRQTPTPVGTYRFFRQIDSWHKAPLGNLYRPKYFYRGYAVHGVKDGNIPAYPASHGCARVSVKAMDMMWGTGGVRIKDKVQVY